MEAWSIFYGILSTFGDWMVDQIDHNDYLAGAAFALGLISIVYLIGVIDIVIR